MTLRTLTSVRSKGRLQREEGGLPREHEQGRVEGARSHSSVMVKEALQHLAPGVGEQLVDATAGEGGHSYELLQHAPKARLLALDADPRAVEVTRERLQKFGTRAEVVEANFGDLGKVLKHKKIHTVHKVLFDLGWNSGQLGSGRGFSFLVDEPLNMSYGKKSASGFTAAEALNEWDEETLANVFYGYGEERYARRIAKAVIVRREIQPIRTTLELVEIVRDSTPSAYHRGRIHCATRTFQALRMAVNDELGVIDRGVRAAWEHLAPHGRIAVITFHSIEDRAVKRLFAEFAKQGGTLVVKKPLVPTRTEISHNPRARSSKLRVIEKKA
jgi:16S rRNA (cytosine1402-N4)-methyltransferase